MNHLSLLFFATFVALQSMEGRAGAQTNGSETAPSSVSPSGVEVAATTRALFRKGLAAYNSGQVDTARMLFLQAWAIRPSADVAMQLAQTEMDLGRYVEAAEHLEYALRNFTPSINEKMRNIARQAHSEVRRHVAQINVEVDKDGAEVLLNGRVIGRSPLFKPLYVEPGDCIVQARLGRDMRSQTVSTESGKDFSVRLVLSTPMASSSVAAPKRGIAHSDPSPFRDELNSSRSLVPLAIGGTVAIVGAATGLGLHLAADADEDNAKSLAASLGARDCTGANAELPVCSALRNSLQKSDRERNWSTASFIVGSAALVATAAYWFWPRKKAPTASQGFHVRGAAGTTSATLLISGEF